MLTIAGVALEVNNNIIRAKNLNPEQVKLVNKVMRLIAQRGQTHEKLSLELDDTTIPHVVTYGFKNLQTRAITNADTIAAAAFINTLDAEIKTEAQLDAALASSSPTKAGAEVQIAHIPVIISHNGTTTTIRVNPRPSSQRTDPQSGDADYLRDLSLLSLIEAKFSGWTVRRNPTEGAVECDIWPIREDVAHEKLKALAAETPDLAALNAASEKLAIAHSSTHQGSRRPFSALTHAAQQNLRDACEQGPDVKHGHFAP